jgi:hypothetical protein
MIANPDKNPVGSPLPGSFSTMPNGTRSTSRPMPSRRIAA